MSGDIPGQVDPRDQSSAQFDAEAAEKAKDFLNEGVNRYTKNGFNTIVDQEGYPISDDAAYHRQMVETAADRLTDEDKVDGISEDVPSQEPPVSSTNMTPRETFDYAKYHAKEHYKANQAGYVAQAVEDANRAGVDVKLSGHNFPAKQPKPVEKQDSA